MFPAGARPLRNLVAGVPMSERNSSTTARDLWLPCMTLALSAACSSCGTNHASSADGGSTQDATIDGSEGGPQDSSALDADSASIADGGNIADSASSSDAGGCLATGSVPTSAVRPRVFMGLTGSNFLADSDGTVHEQWTYVRQNLDGIWGNNANVTAEEEASLWCKIATRTLITEWDAVPDRPDAGWVPVGIFSGAQAAHPDLVINREAISFWPPSPSSWEGVTIASAKRVRHQHERPRVGAVRLGVHGMAAPGVRDAARRWR